MEKDYEIINSEILREETIYAYDEKAITTIKEDIDDTLARLSTERERLATEIELVNDKIRNLNIIKRREKIIATIINKFDAGCTVGYKNEDGEWFPL